MLLWCKVIGYEIKITASHDRTNNNQTISPAAIPIAEVDISNQRWLTKTKVLFSTGVQKSFISKETIIALNLPKIGQAQLKILVFLTNNNTQTYDSVSPIIKLSKFKTKITAVVIPDMNTNLTIKDYKGTADYLKIKAIKLADENIITSDEVGPIQLIVDSDYYGKFIGKTLKKYGVQMLTTAGGNLIVGPLLPAITVLPTPRADPHLCDTNPVPTSSPYRTSNYH